MIALHLLFYIVNLYLSPYSVSTCWAMIEDGRLLNSWNVRPQIDQTMVEKYSSFLDLLLQHLIWTFSKVLDKDFYSVVTSKSVKKFYEKWKQISNHNYGRHSWLDHIWTWRVYFYLFFNKNENTSTLVKPFIKCLKTINYLPQMRRKQVEAKVWNWNLGAKSNFDIENRKDSCLPPVFGTDFFQQNICNLGI